MSSQKERAKKMINYNQALVGAKSDKGPVRPANEDAFWVPDETTATELGALYIVTDGVGGQEEGAAAARLAALVVGDTFYQLRQAGEGNQAALAAAIRQANQAVYEEGQARGRRMGCTIVAAVQDQGHLYLAHVGDARAYLLRDGRLQQLTRDDTWVQKQVDAGLISAAAAAQHELRNVVSQVLGNKPEVKVNLAEARALRTGDILLLCSDGLSDTLSEDEMRQLLSDNAPLAAAITLTEAATVAGANDNITAVVVKSGHGEVVATAPIPSRHPRRRFPLWIPLVLLLLLALSAALATLWLWPDLRQVSLSENEPAGVVDSAAEFASTPPVVALPLPTFTPAAVNVVALQATSTIRPTDTATAPATATVTATPLPSPTPLLYACVGNSVLFVWQDEQVESNRCGQFAGEGFVLNPGDEVQLLDLNTITVSGPDAACLNNTFIKVQSVNDPEIEGWVIVEGLQMLSSGERCNP